MYINMYIYAHILMYIYVEIDVYMGGVDGDVCMCMWRDVRMQMHVLVHAHTSRHASMCMHVCMCALPTAA